MEQGRSIWPNLVAGENRDMRAILRRKDNLCWQGAQFVACLCRSILVDRRPIGRQDQPKRRAGFMGRSQSRRGYTANFRGLSFCGRQRFYVSMFAKLKAAVPRAAQAAFFAGVMVVAWLSLEPRHTPDRNFWEQMDHLPHVLAYGALALSAAMGFQRGWTVLAACLGLIVLGTFLEFAQLYVPGRSAGFGDVIANVIGVTFGLAAAKVGERIAGIKARQTKIDWLQ